jgi:hypothetical protein
MKLFWICATVLASAAHAEVSNSGSFELLGSAGNTPRAWTQRGVGAVAQGDGVSAEARLALDWQGDAADDPPRFALFEATRWHARLELLARANSAGKAGRALGFTQAFLDYGALDTDFFRVRVGQAFAGSSRENIESTWQSPFGISFSALNSWIGEEFRPIGVEFVRRFDHGGSNTDVSAQVFVGNDTGPAVLAWRGFAIHQRLSVYGEALPLLALPALRDNTIFGRQRNDGSQPFGPDLDHRPGYSVRMRHATLADSHFSAMWVDNRGDQALHDQDEYAWNTHFLVLGFDTKLAEDWTLLGELLRGKTLMGFPGAVAITPAPNVQFAFNASYLTLSHSRGLWTQSLRIENFHINERDRSPGERDTQNGNAITFCVLRNAQDWRLGAELQFSDITRPGNAEFGGKVQQGGAQLQLLARRYF